jgi:hypothetical protein
MENIQLLNLLATLLVKQVKPGTKSMMLGIQSNVILFVIIREK